MTGTAYPLWSTKMSLVFTYYRLDPPYRYTWNMEPCETRFLALLQDESAPSSNTTILALAPALPGPVPEEEPFVPMWDVHWRDSSKGDTRDVLLMLGYELLEEE